jgi:hypothetical protein
MHFNLYVVLHHLSCAKSHEQTPESERSLRCKDGDDTLLLFKTFPTSSVEYAGGYSNQRLD